jgi:hypothetical protein
MLTRRFIGRFPFSMRLISSSAAEAAPAHYRQKRPSGYPAREAAGSASPLATAAGAVAAVEARVPGLAPAPYPPETPPAPQALRFVTWF